jgi:hypothetical protein
MRRSAVRLLILIVTTIVYLSFGAGEGLARVGAARPANPRGVADPRGIADPRGVYDPRQTRSTGGSARRVSNRLSF